MLLLKMLHRIVLLLAISWTTSAFGQTLTANLASDPLSFLKGKDSLVDLVLDHPELYRFQFIFTEIRTNKRGVAFGQTYDFSHPDLYFYPASVVKLPIALLALEKLNELGYSTDAILKINRDQECGNMSFVDESQGGTLSFEGMIRNLIVVSNNPYFNALYHFLSPKLIHAELRAKGFNNTWIFREFSGCEMPLNLKTNSLSVYENGNLDTLFQDQSVLQLTELPADYRYTSTKLIGSKHEYRGKIVNGPYDFNYALEYSLCDIHATSLRLFFPEFYSKKEQWQIREEDRQFLLKSMEEVPKDLGDKVFQDEKEYPDNLYKYLVHGDGNPIYDSIITRGKIGISFGFVTETAHVIDPNTNKQYVLSASIYVNANDTVNDGIYEYDQVARPFFARLGQLLLEME